MKVSKNYEEEEVPKHRSRSTKKEKNYFVVSEYRNEHYHVPLKMFPRKKYFLLGSYEKLNQAEQSYESNKHKWPAVSILNKEEYERFRDLKH
jgi:hypothetical protein